MPRNKETAKLLRDLVEGLEQAVSQFEFECFPEAVWEPYVAARAHLGSPVESFKGGFEGEHFHFITFDPAREKCDNCEEP